MRVVGTVGADDPVAAAAVPPRCAVVAVPLGDIEEGPPDTGTALLRSGDQPPDFAGAVGDLVDVDTADGTRFLVAEVACGSAGVRPPPGRPADVRRRGGPS